MITYPNRPIRYGAAFRDGKLYSFCRNQGILVASQWPDMRAWRKTPKGDFWRHVRPKLFLWKTEEGWSCNMDAREPRQRDYIGRGHIRWRLECEQVYQDAPLEEDRDEPADADESCMEDPARWAKNARWDYHQERKQTLHAEYLRPIPEEILTAVSGFPDRHWHLLNLLARCPGAFDLLRSTPALAFALSSLWAFRPNPPQRPLRVARSLISKHQTEIAAWLGFPDAWSTVKILRKLPPEECTVLNLLRLRTLFTTHLKILQHLSSISGSGILMMSYEKHDYRVTLGYLEEIAAVHEVMNESAKLLRDTLWMRKRLADTAIIRLRSYKDLIRVHDHYVSKLGRLDLKYEDLQSLPPPPLHPYSPYLEMEPLQSERELIMEGKDQGNCVGAYASLVRKGRMYLYRLTYPERATIAISRTATCGWRLEEIKAKRNSEVLPETLSAVLEWIDWAGQEKSDECGEVDAPF